MVAGLLNLQTGMARPALAGQDGQESVMANQLNS